MSSNDSVGLQQRAACGKAFFDKLRMCACAFAAACALCLGLAMAPQTAWAYFSLAPVDIYLGQAYVSLQEGNSASISCGLSMESEAQAPGCGMAECPQLCGGLTTPDGVLGGCQDANGWCTCMGSGYNTYYTNVTVSSDNPGVARAMYSGGVLTVTGYAPGQATLTLCASLRQHNDGYATMTVEVTAIPEPEPTPVAEPESGSDAGSSSASGSGSGSTSGAGSASSASTSGSGSQSSAGSSGSSSVSVDKTSVAAAESTEDRKAEVNEVEQETESGDKILLVEATDAVRCSEELAKVVGTSGRCTFWKGGTIDAPAISWTFFGEDLDPAGNLDMDLGVTVSNGGTGALADALKEAGVSAIVMEWAHEGALPAVASVYVRCEGMYDDGTALKLFYYNEADGTFVQMLDGIEVLSSYAAFGLDHCSTWALSTDDLTGVTVQGAAAASQGADAASDKVISDIARVNSGGAQAGAPWLAAVIAALVVVAAAAAFFALRMRKRNARAIEPDEVAE